MKDLTEEQKKTLIESADKKALELATRVHDGQKDKAGRPYIGHPVEISRRVKGSGVKIVALLHDTIEDAADPKGVSKEIRELFGPGIWKSVDLLTRRKTDTYMEYIEKIKKSSDKWAMQVKLADIEDHLDKKASISSSLVKRYEKAKALLLSK